MCSACAMPMSTPSSSARPSCARPTRAPRWRRCSDEAAAGPAGHRLAPGGGRLGELARRAKVASLSGRARGRRRDDLPARAAACAAPDAAGPDPCRNPRPGPLPRPWPGRGPVVQRARGRALPAQPAQHLQGDPARPRQTLPRHWEPGALGRGRHPAAQRGADRGRRPTCQPCQPGLGGADRRLDPRGRRGPGAQGLHALGRLRPGQGPVDRRGRPRPPRAEGQSPVATVGAEAAAALHRLRPLFDRQGLAGGTGAGAARQGHARLTRGQRQDCS
mmetsp:Transcript_87431/g.243453  ORF Transcript_87431/g.243453 Transcript_87431/m.243453 type:complete len:275 (+) Transcript_87431:6020-6844(+)